MPPPVPAHAELTLVRPADAVLVIFDTGRRQLIKDTLLLGRSPENGRTADGRRDHPVLGLADLSRTLSKTHALLEWSGTVLWVTDLGSANGSVLISPDGERRPLVPGIRGPAAIGWTVQCGSRTFRVTRDGRSIVTGTARPRAGSPHPLVDFAGEGFTATETRAPVVFLSAGRASLLSQAAAEDRTVAPGHRRAEPAHPGLCLGLARGRRRLGGPQSGRPA